MPRRPRFTYRTLLAAICACALACGPTEPGTAAPAAERETAVPSAAAVGAQVETSRRTAIVAATERVAPTVVSVTAFQTRLVRGRPPIGDELFDLFFRDFLPPTHIYRERIPSLGSGVLVREDGLVVTNHHVVERADEIRVTLHDEHTFSAHAVAAHPYSDIAVLKIDVENAPAAVLGSSGDLMVGEWVIAVGNPFGNLIADPEPSVSIGVISAKTRSFLPRRQGERKYINMIQTDAAINPGNSGGALANALGEVVGINTFILSRSGGSMGLGFAIPIDHVKRVLREYEEHGAVRDVWLGFDLDSVSPGVQQALGLADTRGAIVTAVHTRGPAYQAGLRPGDVIRGINGRPIGDAEDAELALGYVFPGDAFELEVLRTGREERIRMEAAPAE